MIGWEGSPALGVATTAIVLLSLFVYGIYDWGQTKLLVRRFSKMLPATVAFWSLFSLAIVFESVSADISLPDLHLVVFGAVSLAFAWCGSWFMNDYFDKDTDKHSNADRATAQGIISDREMFGAAVLLVLASFAYGFAIDSYGLLAAVSMVFVNVLYSVPPIRLKAGGVTSMICAGLMGTTGVLMGSATVLAWPQLSTAQLSVVIFLLMFINMSYKDLKDAKHDRKSGVKNFVVMFGQERSRQFLMVSFPLSYVIGAFILGIVHPAPILVVLMIGFGALYLFSTFNLDDVSLGYRIDVLNTMYLGCLAVSYYLLY